MTEWLQQILHTVETQLMSLDQTLRTEIQKAVNSLFNLDIENFQIQPTNPEFEGSHTLVCFPLTKVSRKSPEQTAHSRW